MPSDPNDLSSRDAEKTPHGDHDWAGLRQRVIGLGERSVAKSYYPELRQRLAELERFRTLLDHSRDAILLLDIPSLRVVDATASACAQLGRDKDALTALSLGDLVPTDARDAVLAALEQAAGPDDGVIVTTEVSVPNGAGFPIEMSVRRVRFSDADLAVAVARDISERLELEAQLAQAAKLESLGRLAGGIAHDFNNLLTVILGNGELARAELAANHPAVGPIDEVEIAAKRASDLVRQLLVFARRQSMVPSAVDLNALVRSSEDMLGRLLGEDIEIRAALGPDLDRVLADPGQLHQLLVNLVVNARDAMPSGGRLTISTRNLEIDDVEASVLGITPGSHVELVVSDTGAGMSTETLDHIFEPFFTTKDPGKGTGLGLAICHGIVRQAGGAIAASSARDRGTSFRIVLPVTDSATLEGAPDPGHGVGHGTETILLVEDDDVIRRLAAAGLRARGYRVLEASNGAVALEIAAAQPYDLAVSDVVMPGMNGAELGRHLRAVRPDAALILASGHPRVADQSPSELAGSAVPGVDAWDQLDGPAGGGADAFLWKPYTPDRLGRLVRRVLDDRRGAS